MFELGHAVEINGSRRSNGSNGSNDSKGNNTNNGNNGNNGDMHQVGYQKGGTTVQGEDLKYFQNPLLQTMDRVSQMQLFTRSWFARDLPTYAKVSG